MEIKKYLPDKLVNNENRPGPFESEVREEYDSTNDDSRKYTLNGKEVNRTGKEISSRVRKSLEEKGVPTRAMSLSYLNGAADFTVVNAMRKQKARDLSSAEWSIVPRDEYDENDTEIEQIKDRIRSLHDEYSHNELRFKWEMERQKGEVAVILRRNKETGETGRVIIPDVATMFKTVQNGDIEEYLQKTQDKEEYINTDDVIWSYYYPPGTGPEDIKDNVYGTGPLHDAITSFKKLESLVDKNMDNLDRGTPNGALTFPDIEESPISESGFKKIKKKFLANHGKRHYNAIYPANADFVKFDDEWSNLDWETRKKDAIKEVASSLGVPASYAHYSDDSMNYNQDESQKQTYETGALQETKRQFESVMNEILREWTDKYKYKLEHSEKKEQKKKKRMERLEKMAKTKQELDEANIPVSIQNEKLEVGEVEFNNENNEEDKSVEDTIADTVADKIESFQENQYNTRTEEIEEKMRDHGDNIEEIMDMLIYKHKGNVSAVKEEIEEYVDGTMSRPTVYDIIDDCGKKEKLEDF